MSPDNIQQYGEQTLPVLVDRKPVTANDEREANRV